jgi:carotenoid cleavage dioxygenase-like enzyme
VPHDSLITENGIILSNMPLGVNTDEMMKAGGDYWRLISDRPSEFLVSPRNENAPNHPDWNPGEFQSIPPLPV